MTCGERLFLLSDLLKKSFDIKKAPSGAFFSIEFVSYQDNLLSQSHSWS